MQSFGDKRSMYNGENKIKEEESTLLNTIENLFCSITINDEIKRCGNEFNKQIVDGQCLIANMEKCLEQTWEIEYE